MRGPLDLAAVGLALGCFTAAAARLLGPLHVPQPVTSPVGRRGPPARRTPTPPPLSQRVRVSPPRHHGVLTPLLSAPLPPGPAISPDGWGAPGGGGSRPAHARRRVAAAATAAATDAGDGDGK